MAPMAALAARFETRAFVETCAVAGVAASSMRASMMQVSRGTTYLLRVAFASHFRRETQSIPDQAILT